MRIKHFFGLAVIAAMTASCSSNNDLVNGGGNGSSENETGVGYATLSINLPTTNGTRLLAILILIQVMLTSMMSRM